MKRLMIAATASALTGGCISLTNRMSKHGDSLAPYQATCEDFSILTWRGYRHAETDEERSAYIPVGAVLTLPSLIDLPFEAVVDTVCLPYDLLK